MEKSYNDMVSSIKTKELYMVSKTSDIYNGITFLFEEKRYYFIYNATRKVFEEKDHYDINTMSETNQVDILPNSLGFVEPFSISNSTLVGIFDTDIQDTSLIIVNGRYMLVNNKKIISSGIEKRSGFKAPLMLNSLRSLPIIIVMFAAAIFILSLSLVFKILLFILLGIVTSAIIGGMVDSMKSETRFKVISSSAIALLFSIKEKINFSINKRELTIYKVGENSYGSIGGKIYTLGKTDPEIHYLKILGKEQYKIDKKEIGI